MRLASPAQSDPPNVTRRPAARTCVQASLGLTLAMVFALEGVRVGTSRRDATSLARGPNLVLAA